MELKGIPVSIPVLLLPKLSNCSLQKICAVVTQVTPYSKENSGVQLLLPSKETDILPLTEVQWMEHYRHIGVPLKSAELRNAP